MLARSACGGSIGGWIILTAMNPTIVRRVQIGLLVVGTTITVMAFCLVAGCYKNDSTIEASKATVMADVVSADPLHAEVYFQTPDGRFHSPRLGLLYPTELSEGQRIRVEYAAYNPDIARPMGRSASLSIIPGLSIAVVGWLIVGLLMVFVAEFSRRWGKWRAERAELASAGNDDAGVAGDEESLVVSEKEQSVGGAEGALDGVHTPDAADEPVRVGHHDAVDEPEADRRVQR